jgi:hypothetical protein
MTESTDKTYLAIKTYVERCGYRSIDIVELLKKALVYMNKMKEDDAILMYLKNIDGHNWVATEFLLYKDGRIRRFRASMNIKDVVSYPWLYDATNTSIKEKQNPELKHDFPKGGVHEIECGCLDLPCICQNY